MKRAGVIILVAALAGIGILQLSSGQGNGQPGQPKPTVDPFADSFDLKQDVRKFLWAVEQSAFRLSQNVAPILKAALKENNRDPWQGILAKDFAGAIQGGDAVTHTCGPVRRSVWTSPSKVDGKAFLDWLFAARARFSELTRVWVHFERLEPLSREELAGDHRGTWTLQFVGTLAAGGLCELEIFCELDFVRVTESPEVDEGWLRGCHVVRMVERCTEKPLFEDVTERANIDSTDLLDRWGLGGKPPRIASLATYLFDYDRDGHLDLLLCDRLPRLFRGLGRGGFEEVTERALLPLRSRWLWMGMTVADFDNDGFEDLLVDVSRGDIGRNEAYKNNGDGTFKRLLPNVFTQLGLSVTNGAVADFDNDGLVDIYLPNSGRKPAEDERRVRWIGDRSMPHGVLLKNLGDWRFRNVTAISRTEAGFRDVFAAAWTDVDLDGDPDLLLANHMGENVELENLGNGTFREHVTTRGFGGFSMGLAVGDLDGDGRGDAYVANMSSYAGFRIFKNLKPTDYPKGVYDLMQGWFEGNVVYRNTGDMTKQGSFVEAGLHFGGWAYGPALADFDGDGRLDVYCPAGYQSVRTVRPDG